VKKAGTVMRTSAVRGALKELPEARAEALALIGNGGGR
jgi:GTP cyclohydrolase I